MDDPNKFIQFKRPNKSYVYEKNRKDILNKLNAIVGIDTTHDYFLLESIDDAKKEEIIDLAEDVKKYFATSKWMYFRYPDKPKAFLSLLKYIYKDMGYDIVMHATMSTKNKVSHREVRVYVNKK
jgi:hypothetical protein